jgi:hypothetical protein
MPTRALCSTASAPSVLTCTAPASARRTAPRGPGLRHVDTIAATTQGAHAVAWNSSKRFAAESTYPESPKRRPAAQTPQGARPSTRASSDAPHMASSRCSGPSSRSAPSAPNVPTSNSSTGYAIRNGAPASLVGFHSGQTPARSDRSRNT